MDIAFAGFKMKSLVGGLERMAARVGDDNAVAVLSTCVPCWVLHAATSKDIVGSGDGRKSNGEKIDGDHVHRSEAVMVFSTAQYSLSPESLHQAL